MAAGSKVKDGFVARVLLWWECSPEERRRTLIALAAGAVAGAIFGVVGCAVGRASGGILEMIKTPGSALTFAILFVLAMVAMVAAVFAGSFIGQRLGGLIASGAVGVLGGLFAGMILGSYWGSALAGAVLAGTAGPLTVSKVPPVTVREFSAYYYSPIAYVITLVVAVIVGTLGFYVPLRASQSPVADMGSVFSWFWILLVILGPLITMRQFAEEVKTGTIEVLTTAPVTDAEIVLGKFLGSLLVFATMMLTTGFYLGTLFLISEQGPDMGTVLGGYIALFLWASFMISLGLLASSVTRDQVISFVVGFLFCLGAALFHVTRYVFPGIRKHESLDKLVGYLSSSDHFFPFIRGIVDTKGVIFFATSTAFVLFLTIKLLGWRKSRG